MQVWQWEAKRNGVGESLQALLPGPETFPMLREMLWKTGPKPS